VFIQLIMKLIDWKDCALMTYTELILGFCNVLMLICRRTSGPMRRAKGGWTPEEVSGCFCFIILLVCGATSFDYVSYMYKD